MIENNNFFSGIEFRAFGHNSQATECMNRQPFFYGVQYVHSGSFYLTVNKRKYNLRGPAAFITAPGVDFAYGSPPGTSRYHCHVCFTGERVERYLNGNLFKLPHLMQEPFIAISNPQQFLNDMLGGDHSYEDTCEMVAALSRAESRELIDNMIDAMPDEYKASGLTVALCFCAVDESITREEVAFFAKLMD